MARPLVGWQRTISSADGAQPGPLGEARGTRALADELAAIEPREEVADQATVQVDDVEVAMRLTLGTRRTCEQREASSSVRWWSSRSSSPALVQPRSRLRASPRDSGTGYVGSVVFSFAALIATVSVSKP